LSLAHVNIVIASPATTLAISPMISTAAVGNFFFVNITVTDVVNLYGWGVTLQWDYAILKFISPPTEGPFLKALGIGTFFSYTYSPAISPWKVDVFGMRLGPVAGKSGSGTLATLKFQVLAEGESLFDLYATTLSDNSANPIAHSVQDGYFVYWSFTFGPANVVGKSAWPEHHHFDISAELGRGEDEMQTLYGKVANLGTTNVYVKVVFNVVNASSGLLVASVSSNEVLLLPGEITAPPVSGDFLVTPGKYSVSATAHYSYGGIVWFQGDKIKTFSFAVVP